MGRQIKGKGGRFRSPNWFVLCDLQILSSSVYHPEQPHAQWLFPTVFGIKFLSHQTEVGSNRSKTKVKSYTEEHQLGRPGLVIIFSAKPVNQGRVLIAQCPCSYFGKKPNLNQYTVWCSASPQSYQACREGVFRATKLLMFCFLKSMFLGVISKVRTSWTNERTFVWHFTPSLPPQTKVWSTMGVMYGRWLCTLSSFFPTTCPNNVFCLTQGRFPGGSASIAKWTWRQSCTVKERYDFYFFFSVFLHAQKRTAGVDLCHSVELERVPVIAYLAPSINLAFKSQSISAMDWLQPHACTSRLFARTCSRSCNNLMGHFIGDLLFMQAPQRDRSHFFSFFPFFFFVTVDRTTNRVQTPSLPYESLFVCPRYVNFWDDPLVRQNCRLEMFLFPNKIPGWCSSAECSSAYDFNERQVGTQD